MHGRVGRRVIGVLLGAAVLASGCSGGGAAGGGPTGAPVAAGGDLCKLLGPGDFADAGVSGAGGPSENNDPPDAYYCVYKGKSSATGGIEFDAFIFDTVADAHESYLDLFGEFDPSDDTAVSVAGADEASLSLPASGSSDPALIGVRDGMLVFVIGVGIPPADAAKTGDALKKLAALVVARGSALGG